MNRRKFISGIAGFCLGLQIQFNAIPPSLPQSELRQLLDDLSESVRKVWFERYREEYLMLAGRIKREIGKSETAFDVELAEFYRS